MRTPRWLTSLLVGILLVTLFPSVASAATATTTTLTATSSTIFPGHLVTFSALVAPNPGGGTVTFLDGSTILGVVNLAPEEGEPADGTAELTTSLALGPHSVTARFDGFGDFSPSQSPAVNVSVVFEHTTGTPTTVTLTAGPIVPAGERQSLTATVQPTPNGGRFIFMEGQGILRTESLPAGASQVTISVPLTAGPHSIVVIYDGTPQFAASISGVLNIFVPPDNLVSATGIGLSHATVYPIVDGFGDTTLIRGTALERLSVIIQIFAASDGRRVRSVGLGTREGFYSFAWDGKTIAGGLVPEGRYNVVQTLTDRAGNRQMFTNTVTVSHKRRVAKTGVLTRVGLDFDREGSEGFGLVIPRPRPPGDDSVNVYGNLAPDFAFVTYEFRLPSALQYRTVRFEVNGESQPGRNGVVIALLDASGEPAAESTTGTANGRYTVAASPAQVVNSRRVIATVTANGADRAAFRVFSVRLVFTSYALE